MTAMLTPTRGHAVRASCPCRRARGSVCSITPMQYRPQGRAGSSKQPWRCRCGRPLWSCKRHRIGSPLVPDPATGQRGSCACALAARRLNLGMDSRALLRSRSRTEGNNQLHKQPVKQHNPLHACAYPKSCPRGGPSTPTYAHADPQRRARAADTIHAHQQPGSA